MPRRKVIAETLAVALSGLAQMDAQVEQTASKLLVTVKAQNLTTIEAFDEAIAKAYAENGWQVGSGRPKKGETERRNVPHTVRTYVWELRSAYREGLEVWKFATFSALRTARRAIAEAPTPSTTTGTGSTDGNGHGFTVPPELEQDFLGVRLAGTEPNGALWHDAMLTYAKLPAEHRAMYGRQMSRLTHRYQPMTAQPAAPAQPGRKAA